MLLVFMSIAEAIFNVFFFCTVLVPRRSKFLSITIGLSLYLFLSLFRFAGNELFYVLRPLMNLVFAWMYLVFCFRDRISKKLLVFICFYLGIMCLDILYCSLEMIIFDYTMAQVKEYQTIVQAPLRFFVYYSIYYIYALSLVWLLQNKFQKLKKCQFYFLAVPLAEIVMLVSLCCCALLLQIKTLYFTVVFCCLLCAISIGLLFYVMNEVVSGITAQERNLYLEKQTRLQTEHYQALQEQITATRKMRHDIANHLQTISSLIHQGELAQAENCFQEIDQAFEENKLPVYCEHIVINALLHNKLTQAAAHTIEMKIQITLPQKVAIAEADLICLFSNLLDNAIESCERVPPEQRKITIHDALKPGHYILTIVNSKPPELIISDKKRLQTSKGSKDLHGFGLSIIHDITQKYQGTVRMHDQRNFLETIILLML